MCTKGANIGSKILILVSIKLYLPTDRRREQVKTIICLIKKFIKNHQKLILKVCIYIKYRKTYYFQLLINKILKETKKHIMIQR